VDIFKSGTRREELLMSPEELRKIRVLHNYLQDLNSFEIIKFIKEKFEKFKTNDVFLSVMNK